MQEVLVRLRRLAPPRSGPASLTLLAAGFVVLLLSRHPSLLRQPELWGDDGWSWYPDAYYLGARALGMPVNGYLNSFQRLVGLAVQPLPLAWVPAVFAASALGVQVLAAGFLVSDRIAQAWPNRWARLGFALIYICLPNDIEPSGNLTNAPWNLGLLAFLVIVSTPPRHRIGRLFDAIVLLLSGLSGPFCLLLLPVCAWQGLERRTRTDLWRLGLIAAAALVQAGFLLSAHHAGRSVAPLGATPTGLARILAGQVLLGVQAGYDTTKSLPQWPPWQAGILPIALALAGAALTGAAWLAGPALLRKFVLLAGLLLAAALASPQVSATSPQWPVLAVPPMGNRYFLYPMLAWVGVLFVLAGDRRRPLRGIGGGLLLVVLAVGVPRDWSYLALPPTDFPARAAAFDRAPPGTVMVFPIHPPGLTPMTLVKQKR